MKKEGTELAKDLSSRIEKILKIVSEIEIEHKKTLTIIITNSG